MRVSAWVGGVRGAVPWAALACAFTAVEQVPSEAGACAWSAGFEISSNASYDESRRAGTGLPVRDRAGALYRMLIVSDRIDSQGLATVVFDLLPLQP